MAAKATNPLLRKVGPLPVYVWLGVIVVAYLGYTHFKGASSAAATTAAANPVPLASPAPAPPAGTDSLLPPGILPPTGGQGVTVATTGGTTTAAATPATTPAADAAPVDAGAPPSAAAPVGPAALPNAPGWDAWLAAQQAAAAHGALPNTPTYAPWLAAQPTAPTTDPLPVPIYDPATIPTPGVLYAAQMAGGDEMAGVDAGVAGALLFIGAGTNVYDAFSAVMSSPWSTEKFTSDSEEARMARSYVRHAVVISWIYALGGAWIARRSQYWAYPIVGAAIVSVYMLWLYRRAIERGLSSDGMSA